MAGDFVALDTTDDVHALQAAMKEIFTHIFITRYLTLVGFVLLLYDHALTIPEEVSVIWRRRKSLVSWIFLANRYVVPFILAIDLYDKGGLSGGLSKKFCQDWTMVENHLHLLSHGSIHALVALRVSAIWGHRSIIKWGVAISWTLYFIANNTLGSMATTASYKTFYFDTTTQLCFGTIPSYTWAVWIPPLVLESVLFVLTVIRARAQQRNSVKMLPFAHILYRDGFIYFVIISCCSILNLGVWKFAPVSLLLSVKFFTFGVVNVTASRMVLNLRAQGGVSTYESEVDHEYPYFVDVVSHDQPVDVDIAKDIEDQHLAHVKQLRNLKVARPAVLATKVAPSSSRRPATSGSRRSPSHKRPSGRRRPATSEGAIGVSRDDVELWERSLPGETGHRHLQRKAPPADAYTHFRRTIDIEVSSSDSGFTGHRPNSSKDIRPGSSNV